MPIASLRLLIQPTFDAETEAPCGTSVAQAREALSFWRARLAKLPWYRRGARAEAREMARRWQRRLVQAELERRRLGAVSSHVLRAVDWWGPSRSIAARRLARVAWRRSLVVRLMAALAATTALCMLVTAILVVVVVSQVL